MTTTSWPPDHPAMTEHARSDADPRAPSRPDLDSHLIGEYGTGRPGPLFIIVGGLHGNEPAGVLALQEVLSELEREALPLRGRVVGLAGNLEALRQGRRFIDLDLNRVWAETGWRECPTAEDRDRVCHESRAREKLLALIEEEIEASSHQVIFLDLHSTSAGGSPFSIIGDTRSNRRNSSTCAFSVPIGMFRLPGT